MSLTPGHSDQIPLRAFVLRETTPQPVLESLSLPLSQTVKNGGGVYVSEHSPNANHNWKLPTVGKQEDNRTKTLTSFVCTVRSTTVFCRSHVATRYTFTSSDIVTSCHANPLVFCPLFRLDCFSKKLDKIILVFRVPQEFFRTLAGLVTPILSSCARLSLAVSSKLVSPYLSPTISILNIDSRSFAMNV